MPEKDAEVSQKKKNQVLFWSLNQTSLAEFWGCYTSFSKQMSRQQNKISTSTNTCANTVLLKARVMPWNSAGQSKY